MIVKARQRKGTSSLFIVSCKDRDWGTLSRVDLKPFLPDLPGETELDDHSWEDLRTRLEKSAWQRLIGYLARQERSTAECRRYLSRYRYQKKMVEGLIDRAEKAGYLSDERYAGLLVESMANRGRSRMEAMQRLSMGGIHPELAEKALNQSYSREAEKGIIERQVEKAWNRHKRETGRKRVEKTLSALCRMGFPYDEVREMLDRIQEKGEMD